MKFIDEVKLFVQAGRGGDGCLSFRREKFVPQGGPDGGNGGHGGDIIIKAATSCSTLLHLKFQAHIKAQSGEPGRGKKMSGRNIAPIEIKVPVGTLIKLQENPVPLADLNKPGQEFIIVKGGKGGLGNQHFVSSTNRAPRRITPGKEGESCWIHLELKLLADVGIIGLPNAGKSTLLSRISNAKPKIAAYPFTTLSPHLGVVRVHKENSFVIADIPGLIEGAHLGAGLGHRFLKHIDRTKVLLHVLDISNSTLKDPIEDWETINNELKSYNLKFLQKPQIIALNKTDVSQDIQKFKDFFKEKKIPHFPISAATGEGIEKLLNYTFHTIQLSKNDPSSKIAS